MARFDMDRVREDARKVGLGLVAAALAALFFRPTGQMSDVILALLASVVGFALWMIGIICPDDGQKEGE